MAHKPSPNSLIHCAECGEDYSATYKRCPFCGAKNAPQQSDSERPAASSDLEDTYVFDGQELFDGEGEDEYASAGSKGGKRLADKPLTNPFANADINWPRMIPFVCSLVIIVAAMIIVFTVIYPQLRGNPTSDNSQSPSLSGTQPGSDPSQTVDPETTEPVPDNTDPVTEPTDTVPPAPSTGLRSFTTNVYGKDEDGFSLKAGENWRIRLTFDPTSWSGEVTYSVSDTRYATVSDSGNVVNVNQDTRLHRVILTITAGDITLQMPVYCYGTTAAQPSATETPATETPATEVPATEPPASDPPATQAPSGSGTVTVGKKGVIVNVPGGVYVRAEPSTSAAKLASLFNGDPVTVLEDAGNGWYKIVNGPTTGYIKGDYISTD